MSVSIRWTAVYKPDKDLAAHWRQYKCQRSLIHDITPKDPDKSQCRLKEFHPKNFFYFFCFPPDLFLALLNGLEACDICIFYCVHPVLFLYADEV